MSTSEFLVTLAASAGFLVGLGHSQIPFEIVAALLAGGIVAAPLGAWLVRHVPGRMLGVGVGGLIIVTNTLTVTEALGAPGASRALVTGLVLAAWAVLLATAWRRHQRDKADRCMTSELDLVA